jgi:hypothetical protein
MTNFKDICTDAIGEFATAAMWPMLKLIEAKLTPKILIRIYEDSEGKYANIQEQYQAVQELEVGKNYVLV